MPPSSSKRITRRSPTKKTNPKLVDVTGEAPDEAPVLGTHLPITFCLRIANAVLDCEEHKSSPKSLASEPVKRLLEKVFNLRNDLVAKAPIFKDDVTVTFSEGVFVIYELLKSQMDGWDDCPVCSWENLLASQASSVCICCFKMLKEEEYFELALKHCYLDRKKMESWVEDFIRLM